MSDSRTWINIGGAIVGGVLAFFTFGASAVLMGAALGYTVAGIIQGPPSPKQGAMRPDEFQMVQSSEAATIPVIFGTVRLAGNIVGYDKDNFEAIPVYAEQEGGSGSAEPQQTGYTYRMSYDVGFCMGPVDAIVRIQGSPGMDDIQFHTIDEDEEKDEIAQNPFIDRQLFLKWLQHFYEGQDASIPGPIDLTAGSAVTLSMKGKNEDSGRVEFLPGTRTQGIYRDVVCARFMSFTLGATPAPRTYLFTMTRMPRPLNSAGDVITGFPVNAATDPEHSEFGDANPAAVLWELLTNVEWGKGTNPDTLNEDDFKLAAQYFQAKRIGISTSIGDDASSVELAQRFRDLFGLVTWWDGTQIRCRAIWDRDNAYANRPRITPEDIIGEPAFSRQSMVSATNEVRLEFTNRENNWQTEAATAQDLASIESVQGVRSVKMDGKEIGTRRCAELVVHRMLRTMAYPCALCSVAVRRTFAHLQPGDFVELVVDGWRGDAMTTFWRVDQVSDDLTGEDQVRLTLVEDVYATGTDGTVEDFETPIPSIDFDDPLTNEDLVETDYSISTPVGEITPVLVMEPSIWVSKSQRMLFGAVQRRSGLIMSFGIGFREQNVGNFINAGVFQGFAYTGTLVDAMSATGPKIIRQTYQQFRITLNRIEDADRLLGSASSVQAAGDGFDLLTATNTALMIVGREILRVGWIEETGTNEFTVRTAMRGEFASDQAAHLVGDTFHFMPFFERGIMCQLAERLPLNLATDVAINPNTVRGYPPPTFAVKTFAGESIQPLRPELVSATRVGTTWTIKLRPRIYNGGSGYGPDFETEMQAREADVGFHRLRIERTGVATVTLPEYFTTGTVGPSTIQATSFTFTPTDGTSGATGLWTLVVAFDTNPANLVIYGLLNGQTSDPLTIPIPA